ncbi:hypothetical protein CRP9_gp11 [Roseobacter phage CRP-9]|nr:hypothetical protein CRP9_gp11 [Roseobacter phage CRP-9]
MKYKLVVEYPDGKWHLTNTDHGNEWTVVFESELLLLDFMKVLLEEQ